jgi:hypothetical protein
MSNTMGLDATAQSLERRINAELRRRSKAVGRYQWDGLREQVVKELGGDNWEFLNVDAYGGPPQVAIGRHIGQ